MITERDKIYMKRCFELARKGKGMTRTNPMVGCVIVHDDRIIGEGYHHEFGGPHAEVIAIRSVKDSSLFPHATLYCSLEPCAHHGKTPPCSILIRQKGIRRVVVANLDPFPSVNGKGVKDMKSGGIQVETGCLADEGAFLNRRFLRYVQGKRPYVILKWAQSADGFIDLEREDEDREGPRWITSKLGQTLVHKWRSEEAAIMVGTNTVVADNPRLNVRRWSGEDPLRVTIDRKGRIQDSAHILDGSQDTIMFTESPEKYSGRIRSIHIDLSYELEDLLEELHSLQVISLFVEGGARLHRSFIESGLWDEARVFTGKMTFSQGVEAPDIPFSPDETRYFGDARLEVFRNKHLSGD